jgi:hypothetical protein
MNDIPAPRTYTTAPLRHRLRVELDAPVSAVWEIVGDHERLPEISSGIERVELTPERDARICVFRPMPDAPNGMRLVENIRWHSPRVGYATSASQPNDFALENDLSLVTVAPRTEGVVVTWEQYYDHPDLPGMRAGFGQGLEDIGQHLVARFGGRITEQFVDGPMA